MDKAKELLRRRSPFVWNATHLSLEMRTRTLVLLYAYNASVKLVYLEASEPVVFSRNDKRDTTLGNKDLARMLHRWEIPMPWEAQEVLYLTE